MAMASGEVGMLNSASDRRQVWDERKRDYVTSIARRTGVGLGLEKRISSRWVYSQSGSIAILASRSHAPGGLWWFGLNEQEFKERKAIGLILLCEGEEGLLDFAFPAVSVDELLPYLSQEKQRGERKLHLFRRGGRYFLKMPQRPELDVTGARGDFSWLEGPAMADSRPLDRTPSQPTSKKPAAEAPAAAFFARVRKGVLEPLDPPGLADGDVVLVRATIVKTVPGNAALRRIVARGGPATLPSDLAERHDHYARQISQG